jgi:hypothetical protein
MGIVMNRKEQRNAKNARHRRNERRRAERVAQKEFPSFCNLMGAEEVVRILRKYRW